MTDKETVRKDVQTYSALESVANSEGGRTLIKGLNKDISLAIDEICSQYKTAPSFQLRATCARLAERINLLRTLKNANINKTFASKELEEILKEDPDLEDQQIN